MDLISICRTDTTAPCRRNWKIALFFTNQHAWVVPGRWYKYGRRQRRAIVAYTIFGTLAIIILSVVIGAVVYGLQSRPSPTLGESRPFEVDP